MVLKCRSDGVGGDRLGVARRIHDTDGLCGPAPSIRNRRINKPAEIGRPIPPVKGSAVVYARNANDLEARIEHYRVMAGGVPPLVESVNGGVETGGDVFALGRRKVVTERGHSHNRIASLAVNVAEII